MEEKLDLNQVIKDEIARLKALYNKEYLSCEELVEIIGIGRDNVRSLMRSASFPTIRVGKRIVVSIINFVLWEVKTCYLGE